MVTALPRRPGQKEVRYTHLLAGPPELDAPEEGSSSAGPRGSTTSDRVEELERMVGSLRDEVAELRAQFDAFRRQFE